MRILAIEQSTDQRSVALTIDGAIAAASSWELKRGQSSPLLKRIGAVLDEGNVALADVDVFVVGRGPGNFSGLRIAMSTATAFAIPDKKPVYAVSSGEALAFDIAKDHADRPIVILGDARRHTLWSGIFHHVSGHTKQIGAWQLWDSAQAMDELPKGAVVASPDWGRLSHLREELEDQADGLISEANYPTAQGLAELSERRIAEGVESEPLSPIYMHPAVALPTND